MEADLSVLDTLVKDIDPSTIRPVGGGVWFAWRTKQRLFDVRNGVWWLDDGSKVVSLAVRTGLHVWDGVDWETYVFRPSDVDIDVCCHDSEEEAEKCAITFFSTGHWCRNYEE